MTTRSGLSESLPEGAPGMVEELLVWWDREGRGGGRENDNTHPFAIVLGKERRMEE